MMHWKNSPKRQQSGFASRIRLALRNTHGETITEVLVAMVIVGLALLMLAVVIASSSSIVKKDREYMEDYYETGNTLAMYTGEPKYEGASLTVTWKGTSVKLSPPPVSTSIASAPAARPSAKVYRFRPHSWRMWP